MMNRRGLVVTLAGGLCASSRSVRAQPKPIPVIGFLSGRSPGQAGDVVAAFRQGLLEAGFVDGKNATIEFRWAEGDFDRLRSLAVDLVVRRVTLLVATGGPRAALAAKSASTTIPIVFTMGGDPVGLGMVDSLGHPGGNATGISFLIDELVAKRLELLHELVPRATVLALIVNPNTPTARVQAELAREVARSLGQELQVLNAGTKGEIDSAFASLSRPRLGALVVGSDAFLAERREQFVALAARYAIPASYEGREAVVAGGLMSYGPSLADTYRQAGIYAGRILGGANPADLPVLQPTKFELVLNRKTANALRLTIPQSLLMRATEIIE